MPTEEKRIFEKVSLDQISRYVKETLKKQPKNTEKINTKSNFHNNEMKIGLDKTKTHDRIKGKIIIVELSGARCSTEVSWENYTPEIDTLMNTFWQILDENVKRNLTPDLLYAWFSPSESQVNDWLTHLCVDKDGNEVEATNFSKTANEFSYLKDLQFVAMVKDGIYRTNKGTEAGTNTLYRECINCRTPITAEAAEKHGGWCDTCLQHKVCDLCGQPWNEGALGVYLLTKTISESNYPNTYYTEKEITRDYGSICEKCFVEQTGAIKPADLTKKQTFLSYEESEEALIYLQLVEETTKNLAANKLYKNYPQEVQYCYDKGTHFFRDFSYSIRTASWWNKHATDYSYLNFIKGSS